MTQIRTNYIHLSNYLILFFRSISFLLESNTQNLQSQQQQTHSRQHSQVSKQQKQQHKANKLNSNRFTNQSRRKKEKIERNRFLQSVETAFISMASLDVVDVCNVRDLVFLRRKIHVFFRFLDLCFPLPLENCRLCEAINGGRSAITLNEEESYT